LLRREIRDSWGEHDNVITPALALGSAELHLKIISGARKFN
jgi:hypothetical protein